MFQECLKGVSRVFHGCYKSVSRVFQECFKSVSRVFQEWFKGVSRAYCVLWFASTQHSAEQLERVGDYNLLVLDVVALLLACLMLYSATRSCHYDIPNSTNTKHCNIKLCTLFCTVELSPITVFPHHAALILLSSFS